MTLDFRSDLLGTLSAASLAAINEAARRPASFEPCEDRFERALAARIAALTGFAAALLVPTCTMANQIALRIWCAPGEAVCADRMSHVATTEAPSAAALSGIVIAGVDGVRGHPSPPQVRAVLAARRPDTARRLSLVWLENTHNRAGGSVMPAGWLAEIAAACQ